MYIYIYIYVTAYIYSCFSKSLYSGPSGNPSGNLPDASGMRPLSYRITGWITDRITDRDYGSTYRPTYGDKSDPGAAKAGIDQFVKEKLYENGMFLRGRPKS